jgi:NTP pyrophosphatase (non-canonical NTP hydrolase)
MSEEETDYKISIGELKELIIKFREDRNWAKYHTPKNLAESISIEAAELLEKFQWKNDDEINQLLNDPKYLNSIKNEISDILCMAIGNVLGIDISDSVIKKVKKILRNIQLKNRMVNTENIRTFKK